MSYRIAWTAAAVIGLAMVSPARAAVYGTVQLHVNNNVGLGVSAHFDSFFGASNVSTTAGEFGVSYSSPGPFVPPLGPRAFCIETESTGVPATNTYTVCDVEDVPLGRGPIQQGGLGMGSAKANLIRELWGRYIDTVDTTVERAAFQMAVWELVHEDTPGPYNVKLGTPNNYFYVNSPSGSVLTAANQANTWLGSLNGTGPLANLMGLGRRGSQDFIVESVPEPGTISLLAFGGVALWRRRRR